MSVSAFQGCRLIQILACPRIARFVLSLRWAELAALTPADIDLDALTVRVTRQLYYHEAGYSFGPPKSRASVRVVAFPALIAPDVRSHLEWLPALVAAGLEGVHLHDLRHTGNQLIANAGANPKELMARMGHDSERAALVDLHSTGHVSAPWLTR